MGCLITALLEITSASLLLQSFDNQSTFGKVESKNRVALHCSPGHSVYFIKEAQCIE